MPTALFGKEIYLDQLIIPSGGNTRLSVKVPQSRAGQAEVSIEIQGALPEGEMEVLLPKQASKPARVTNEGRSLPLMNHAEGLTNVIGVRMPIQSFVRLQFEE